MKKGATPGSPRRVSTEMANMDAVPRFRQAPLARKIKLLLLLRGGLRLVDALTDAFLIALATGTLL